MGISILAGANNNLVGVSLQIILQEMSVTEKKYLLPAANGNQILKYTLGTNGLGGILISNSAGIVTGNTISGNTGVGITLNGGTGSQISNNTIGTNTGGGISISNGGGI